MTTGSANHVPAGEWRSILTAHAVRLHPTIRPVLTLGFLAFFLLCLALGQAAAQQPSQAQAAAIRSNCRSDYMSYCSNVPTGGRASLQCLQEHLVDLSPACQSAVKATEAQAAPPATAAAQAAPSPPPQMGMREEARLMRNACGSDFRAYCEGVSLGGGRALACLAANERRLSPVCKGALAKARASR